MQNNDSITLYLRRTWKGLAKFLSVVKQDMIGKLYLEMLIRHSRDQIENFLSDNSNTCEMVGNRQSEPVSTEILNDFWQKVSDIAEKGFSADEMNFLRSKGKITYVMYMLREFKSSKIAQKIFLNYLAYVGDLPHARF